MCTHRSFLATRVGEAKATPERSFRQAPPKAYAGSAPLFLAVQVAM